MRPEGVLRDVRDGVVLVEYPGAPEEDANRAAVGAGRAALGRRSPGRARCGSGRADAARGLRSGAAPARTAGGRRSEGRPRSRKPSAARASCCGFPSSTAARMARTSPSSRARAGMSAEEFARRHASAEYRVAFIGFAPGFPYLDGLPAELAASASRDAAAAGPGGQRRDRRTVLGDLSRPRHPVAGG